MNKNFIKEQHKRLVVDINLLIANNAKTKDIKLLNDYLLATMIALSMLD